MSCKRTSYGRIHTVKGPDPLYTSGANILHRYCFSLSLGLALAANLPAADGSISSAVQPARMTSVVRSDQRTGKLVRSVVVTAKPVTERKVAETVVSPRVVSPLPTPEAAPVPVSTPAQ